MCLSPPDHSSKYNDMTDNIVGALPLVFNYTTLSVILISALFGLFVGAIPGLSATMATAILVPITFFMDPVPAIAAIVTTAAMAIFASDIPPPCCAFPEQPPRPPTSAT